MFGGALPPQSEATSFEQEARTRSVKWRDIGLPGITARLWHVYSKWYFIQS